MHKQELITQVAKAAEVSQQRAAAVIDAVIHAVTNAMAAGESVSLVGFGTFSVSERSARLGRNPATGATIDIPARKSPSFKAGGDVSGEPEGQGGVSCWRRRAWLIHSRQSDPEPYCNFRRVVI